MSKDLERAAQEAVAKHQRLQNEKVLDLVLGNMVHMDGVHAVRQKLMWYYNHLEEFDSGQQT